MQINRTNFWSRNNYFWKVPISHIIQNHWKKLALSRARQFHFNSGKYPIRQLLSLKLPMDSQCIQASSSISVPNVRRDFHIYFARQSATLTKMSKLCFVWQYEYGCFPLLTEILNSSSKILVLQWLFGIMLVYCSQKVKWHTFPKMFV